MLLIRRSPRWCYLLFAWVVIGATGCGPSGGSGDGDGDGDSGEEEQSLGSCLRLEATFTELGEEEEIDFGVLREPMHRVRQFDLRNCATATADLEIEALSIEGDGFSFLSQPQVQRLGPGQRIRVEVEFRPVRTGESKGTIRLQTEEEERLITLRGALWRCPSFTVGARPLGTNDAFGRDVFLTNQYSRGEMQILGLTYPEGEEVYPVVDWEWSLNGEGTINKINGGESIHLHPAEPGYLSVEVEGVTAQGWRCGATPNWSIGVHNSVGADVLVVLDWDIENALDSSDIINIDLHYRQRSSPWRDPRWDVYSRNQAPDWEDAGRARMEHYVLRYGRWESTLHQEPRQGDRIEIGAHIIRGLEFEEGRIVDVRARVAIRGALTLSLTSGLDSLNRGWHVGTVMWPDQSIEVADQLYPVLWEAP